MGKHQFYLVGFLKRFFLVEEDNFKEHIPRRYDKLNRGGSPLCFVSVKIEVSIAE